MRNAKTYGRRLVEWLALFALGHGIILYLATIEIFPDRFVAAMITTAVAAPAWAHWIMAALFGLLGTFLLERFLWNRHGSLATRTPDHEAQYAHFLSLVGKYPSNLRVALRQLITTDNPEAMSSDDWSQFHRDGIVDAGTDGSWQTRGPIKKHLIGVLDEVLKKYE